MLKRLRAKHPVGFCVLSEVLFLGSLLLASYLSLIHISEPTRPY